MNRGIIIDPDGFFLAAVQWDPKTEIGPDLHNIIPKKVCKLLPEKAAEEGMEFGRWNEKEKKWEYPDKEIFFVDGGGNLHGSRKVWEGQRYSVPAGLVVVEVPRPPTHDQEATWDFDKQEWRYPKRVLVFDKKGKLVNTECVFDIADAAVPKGGRVEEVKE